MPAMPKNSQWIMVHYLQFEHYTH